MTSDDQAAVERVLAGLRSVEPPVGLEERVLRAVEARVSVRAGRRMTGSAWLGARGGAGVACGAGAFLAACVVIFGVHRGTGHRVVPGGVRVSRVSAVVAAAPVVRAQRTQVSATGAGRLAAGRVRRVDASLARVLDRGSEAMALEEMRAPSQPAPPLPLTQQEKLLLRVVAKGAPEEIAMLDPVQREKAETIGKEEVQRFFDPPKHKVEEHE